jgi:integrase
MAIVPRKTKSGLSRYQVKVKDQRGSWMPTKTFARRIDAERHERVLLNDQDSGVLSMNLKAGATLFQDYVEIWKSKCRLDIHEGWKSSQDQMAKDYLLPILGARRVNGISSIDVGDVLARMQKMGRSAQTMLHVYQLMRKMMEDAVKEFRMISCSPVLKKYRPKVTITERRYLNPGQSRQLLAISRDQFAGPAIWLGLLAGLRSSEIQSLTWDAVDFHGNRIIIRSAYKRKIKKIEDFPKQGDWGEAPMCPDLAAFLKTLNRRSEFVACGKNGGMLEQKVFHETLLRLCKTNGLPIISPHELRHSCTGIWMEGGATALDLQKLLNHKDPITTSRYIHGLGDRLKEISSRVTVSVVKPKPKLHVVNSRARA